MKLRINQLKQHLDPLAKIYLLHGAEPLLIEESFAAIKQAAQTQGFNELTRLSVTTHFNWTDLDQAFANLDLFHTKTFVKLTFPSGKPGKSGSEAIERYLKQAKADQLLVIVCENLEFSTYKTTWYKSVEKSGVVLQAWPLQGEDLKSWILEACARHEVRMDKSALEFFLDCTTGNLLAAKQELEKLFLLYGSGELTREKLEVAMTDQAHFDIFNLTQALVANQGAEYLRILSQLKAQGVAETLVLWSISRELRTLAQLAYRLKWGESLKHIVAELPSNKRANYERHLQTYELADYQKSLQTCATIDRSIKGLDGSSAWEALRSFATLC